MSRLVAGRTKHNGKSHICPHCVSVFTTKIGFIKHLPECSRHVRQKMVMQKQNQLRRPNSISNPHVKFNSISLSFIPCLRRFWHPWPRPIRRVHMLKTSRNPVGFGYTESRRTLNRQQNQTCIAGHTQCQCFWYSSRGTATNFGYPWKKLWHVASYPRARCDIWCIHIMPHLQKRRTMRKTTRYTITTTEAGILREIVIIATYNLNSQKDN